MLAAAAGGADSKHGPRAPLAAAATAAVRLRAPEAAAAGALFYATAVAGQRAMGGAKITAASWLAAPAAGLAAVTLGACAAGHGAVIAGNAASIALTGQRAHAAHANYLQSTTAFATTGVVCFWLLGGKGAMVCPSDLRYMGAYAKMGIPCTVEYADNAMRGRVQMIGHIFGCHSCGVRHAPEAGLWVADHQPPNNIAKGMSNEPLRRAVFRLSGERLGGRPPQQFYPHCVECSNWQVRVPSDNVLPGVDVM